MSEAEVNWRDLDLKEGDRVKVGFEAEVKRIDEHRVILDVDGGDQGSTVFIASELDAAKITRIERPWKKTDTCRVNGLAGRWEIVGFRGDDNGKRIAILWGASRDRATCAHVTRLEPSDDR